MKPVFFYHSSGALMCDRVIPGLTQTLNSEGAAFYGGENFVCETITLPAAKRIAEALGGEWRDIKAP